MKLLSIPATDSYILKSAAGILFYILFFQDQSYAQTQFGIGIGISNNILKASEDHWGQVNIERKNGMIVNAFISIPLKKSFDLIIEPGLIQKNYLKKSISDPVIRESLTNNYLQLPVSLRIPVFKKNKYITFVDLGAYGGYWLGSKEKGQLPDILSGFDSLQTGSGNKEFFHLVSFAKSYQFNKTKDNRYEAGMNLGLGESMTFKRSTLSIKAYFLRSFTDQQKNYMINQTGKYNQSLNLQLTYAVNFKSHAY